MTTIRDSVEHAISHALNDGGELVTRWVACIETVGNDGQRGLFLLSNDDVRTHRGEQL